MNFINLITAVSVFWSAAYFALQARPKSAKKAIARFQKTFDIVAHGQRFQGNRATKLYTFYSYRHGISSYKSKSLYKTPSGRFFEIDLVCEFASIVTWKLDLIDPLDATEFLALIESSEDVKKP